MCLWCWWRYLTLVVLDTIFTHHINLSQHGIHSEFISVFAFYGLVQSYSGMQSSRPVVQVVRLGVVSYLEALRLQQDYVSRHWTDRGPAHALLLCEHLPVYTTGIRQKPYPPHLLDHLTLMGAEVHRTNRGGLITFHGPGQLVCYPVLHLGSFKKV